MRVIILSFILLLCSCCPVDSSNSSTEKKIEKKDEIVVNCSNKYRIYQDNYGTVTFLYEFELHEHIFLVNTWNDRKLIHAPWCPCKQKFDEPTSNFNTSSINSEDSIFSNSYF